MKNLLSLSFFLIIAFFFISCKKSSDSKYDLPRDTVNYIVKSGTLSINENGKTTTYSTTTNDEISVWLVNNEVDIKGIKSDNSDDVFDLILTQNSSGQLAEQFYSVHGFGNGTLYGTLLTKNNTSIKVTDYMNKANGTLIRGTFSCPFYDLSILNPDVLYTMSGSLNLQLNKK